MECVHMKPGLMAEKSGTARPGHDKGVASESAWVTRVNGGVLSDDDLSALLDRKHLLNPKDVTRSDGCLPYLTTLRLGDVEGLARVEEALLCENSLDNGRVGVVALEAGDLRTAEILEGFVVDESSRFESSKWAEIAGEGQRLDKSWKQVVRWGSPMTKISILRVQEASPPKFMDPFDLKQTTFLYHIVIEPPAPEECSRRSLPSPATRMDKLSAESLGVLEENSISNRNETEQRFCVLPPMDTGFCQTNDRANPVEFCGEVSKRKELSEMAGTPSSSTRLINADFSKRSISSWLDYFGREPLINSLVKSGWADILQSCLNDSCVSSKPGTLIDPYTYRYVKRIRSGGNWLVKPPLGLAFQFCADVVRQMLNSKRRAKTVIIVRSTDRGDLLEAKFRRLGFQRVVAFSGKKKKFVRGWREELRALDIMILTAQFFTNAISTGNGQVTDIDLLIVDECETTKHTNSHNLAMGAFRREDCVKTQVLAIYTGEVMDIKHPEWVQLCANLCVPMANLLLLDKNRDFDHIATSRNSGPRAFSYFGQSK
ncbi:hypothetical protein BSKO_09787 [Bryopsis sp. KO-2023]|nr:hypothetical protein BSKO_09787 [Bryopsis sp. KO-2023]